MGLLDAVLGGMAGGGSRSGRGGMSPMTMAILALLASRAMKGGGGGLGGGLGGGMMGGGLGGLLGGLLGGGMGGGFGSPMGGSMGAGMGGGMGGGLGGLLTGGLGSLLQGFQSAGHGDIADSWVGHGPNRQVHPHQLADALGPQTLAELSDQTGMNHQDVLSELSELLPDAVNDMTPDGRLPTEDEIHGRF